MGKQKVCFRVWIEVNGEPFLGIGRIELLEQILQFGSITEAARSMGMSYRKAWQLVRSMNDLSKRPLVDKRIGGKAGGGALVTAAGSRAIRNFRQLHRRMQSIVRKIGQA